MTREEIDRKKAIAAEALLSKSGVGGIHAVCALGEMYLEYVNCLGLAGSPAEAIVKVALQCAFDDPDNFREFIREQADTEPHARKFRVVR